MTNDFSKRELLYTDIAAWSIAAIGLVLVLKLHLLPALLAGLLVYELTHVLVRLIHSKAISRARARIAAVTLLAVVIITLLVLMIVGVVILFRSSGDSLPALLQKMAEIIDGAKAILPPWLWTYLPEDTDELRTALVEWLRTHAGVLQVAGTLVGRTAAHILIGMVIGALLPLIEIKRPQDRRPLARSLTERVSRIHLSFRRIILAQGRISALNTLFTWMYLDLVLPLMGVDLPLTKTLIVVTFVAGLLPVIGNLISNTIIVIVSLSYALYVAAASLLFLVVIHKLEYFLNARIIGSRINANAWELLLAMLVMEAAFGFAGLVAAPLYYAYLKDELTAKQLV